MEELKTLQTAAIFDALGDYRGNYVLGFQSTQPGQWVVGRAPTMRFLPTRPDVREALDALAAEGDWDRRYYGRAAAEAKPGDVIVGTGRRGQSRSRTAHCECRLARRRTPLYAVILPNVYRAFEFRDESQAYDRLALSVTGDTLTEI